MAYVNPYASAMEYQPRTLWNQPERPRTDWSTFWGKAEEDEDDNGDENGYNPEGIESQVVEGSGEKLKTLWGDVMADMQQNMQSGYDLQQSQNMFDSVFGPGITATNEAQPLSTDVANVGSWQNPNYTGANTQVQSLEPLGQEQATLSALAPSNITATALTDQSTQAYQPSYTKQQQQQNLIDQSTQAYNQQFGQNALNQATIIGDAGQLSATSGGPFTPAQSLGLMDSQIAQDLMRSRTFDTTAAATRGLLEGTEIEDEDEDIETGFWGGGSPHG